MYIEWRSLWREDELPEILEASVPCGVKMSVEKRWWKVQRAAENMKLPLVLSVRCRQIDGNQERNRSTIIVPAGSSGVEGWAAFRNILLQINEEASPFFIPNKQHLESSERLPGLSNDVGAGFISGSGHNGQAVPSSDLNVDRLVENFPHDEVGSMGLSKVIRADQKRFFFDLGSNNRGHFLRISEVAGPDRSSIILPLSGLKPFHEMVGHFVKVTKDKLEGAAGPNVRTLEPSHR
ncbi:Transcription factor Pur-alpha 1 [Platanthera guangdongensis]|uniref:Transcription factor Pur-alpha 1 n=1 Tax=Platanthera guangdongensis TaxID=2320717 RepID=A0ABR2MDN7_9ASPA